MNGLVSRSGVEVCVPTPYNDAIIEVMRDVDAKTITPGPGVVGRILERARG